MATPECCGCVCWYAEIKYHDPYCPYRLSMEKESLSLKVSHLEQQLEEAKEEANVALMDNKYLAEACNKMDALLFAMEKALEDQEKELKEIQVIRDTYNFAVMNLNNLELIVGNFANSTEVPRYKRMSRAILEVLKQLEEKT